MFVGLVVLNCEINSEVNKDEVINENRVYSGI